MKRPIASAVVVLSLLAVPPVLAASGPEPKATAKYDFSAKAAGIEAMVREDTLRSRTLLTVPMRQAAPAKKSFWKTPWPYLIAGGAILAGVLIATSGDGNGY